MNFSSKVRDKASLHDQTFFTKGVNGNSGQRRNRQSQQQFSAEVKRVNDDVSKVVVRG